MTDYGLDLAVIGNGRIAALVEPSVAHRVVVLSALRRRSGVLPPARGRGGKRLLRRGAGPPGRDPLRICAQHRHRRHRADRPATAARCASPISRRASAITAASSARRRLCGSSSRSPGMPRITIRLRPTHHYGKPVRVALGRQQPHPLLARRGAGAAHHRCAALLYRERGPFVLTQPVHLVFGPDEPFKGDARDHLPRVFRAHPRLLAGMGAAAVHLA